MKFVIVMALLTNGHLGFMEYGPYKTLADCKSRFHQLIERYLADGVPLKNINGDCYLKP